MEGEKDRVKSNQNIYQSARECTDFTQEAAAECLHISTESLRMYETGRRRPSDEMAVMMADAYHDAALVYRHIKASPVGCVLPELTERSLQECAMRLFRLLRNIVREERIAALLEIAEDGIIDTQEWPVYNEIMKELYEVVEAVLAISFIPEGIFQKDKKKRPIGRETDKAPERLEYTHISQN